MIAVILTALSTSVFAQFNEPPAVSLKEAVVIAEKAVANDQRFKDKFVVRAFPDSTRPYSGPRKSEPCWRIEWARTYPPAPGSVHFVEVLMDRKSNVFVVGR
jgi:hypothetical protein